MISTPSKRKGRRQLAAPSKASMFRTRPSNSETAKKNIGTRQALQRDEGVDTFAPGKSRSHPRDGTTRLRSFVQICRSARSVSCNQPKAHSGGGLGLVS